MSTSKKVLVVDDDQEIRELLDEYLTKAGFTVITAAEGEEMKRRLAMGTPDLILLDVMMPGMMVLPYANTFGKLLMCQLSC